jgi:uroporphyrinogen-III synthase
MTTNSLFGLKVLITRPAEQQQGVSDAISRRGGLVLQIPLIEIKALQKASSVQALEHKIRELDKYQLLIFVSSNAVRYAASWINDYWPRLPEHICVIAIGATTAQVLSEQIACEAIYSGAGMSSEDLLELAELKHVDGKRIAIFRGQGGRELLADTLSSRGAELDYLEVYQRQSIDHDSREFCQSLQDNSVNVLTVTSMESLARLDSLLTDNKVQLGLLPLLVPSVRVAQQAVRSGFARVINAEGADTLSFIAALELLADKNR